MNTKDSSLRPTLKALSVFEIIRPGRYEMPPKRTTHRSATGKKLYAVRDESGKFKDIQTYKKAQGADVKRRSKAEAKSKKK
jgi:hypothetical protein